MEYMIVFRGLSEIHRVRFRQGEDGRHYLVTDTGIFSVVCGWESERFKSWLKLRDFEYYWERNGHE